MAQWEAFQKIWAKRLREMSDGIRNRSETVNYTVFESMQTMMDYIEESLQNIMLPPSEGIQLFIWFDEIFFFNFLYFFLLFFI